ncbi:MAG: hypothetical protein K0Q48_2324 [Bacillota bacterium]|jgi:hypothetical protein|nr:hypothetical protein [Bacillota bacterium]
MRIKCVSEIQERTLFVLKEGIGFELSKIEMKPFAVSYIDHMEDRLWE